MTELLKIGVTFAVIIFLLRKKVNIGSVMLAASVVLFLLYRMPGTGILRTVGTTAVNSVTIKLLLALSLIRIFEIVLREQEVLTTMMRYVKLRVHNRKAIIVSMPMLIGMLPSLGGAYFSAPMVKEATADLAMTREEKAFINYWFRHPWEYILPLYPGILLAAAVCSIPLYRFISANLPYALAVLITGFLFSMRGAGMRELAGPQQNIRGESEETQRGAFVSFVPVIAVLLMVMVFRVELQNALLLAIIPLVLFYRYRWKDLVRIMKHGFAAEVVLLIFGIMLFKETLEASGAVQNLSGYLLAQGVPVFPVLCILPFVTGFLTGVTVGFVGGTFPLLVSVSGGPALENMSLAFAAGFIGVLLSPVHLCQVLTKEYFKADLRGIYRRTVPSGAIILLIAIAQYFILKFL